MTTSSNSSSPLFSLFQDTSITEKIKKRLPHLFWLAMLDSSRAGKAGMQIGSAREAIIIALLMYKFGEQNIRTDIPITEPEVDVIVNNHPISIKTITAKTIRGGVKAIWTVDAQKAREFVANYKPKCDILFIQVNYDAVGTFAFMPLSVQEEVFLNLGRDKYFLLPKQGTNPRGVEFSKTAMLNLISHANTMKIEIPWIRPTDKYNQYKRWLDYWASSTEEEEEN